MHHPMRFSFKNTKSRISKEVAQYLWTVPLEKQDGNLKQGRTGVWEMEVMAL